MAQLSPGDKAPTFTLHDQSGSKVKLSDYKGRKVLVFFYPRTLRHAHHSSAHLRTG